MNKLPQLQTFDGKRAVPVPTNLGGETVTVRLGRPDDIIMPPLRTSGLTYHDLDALFYQGLRTPVLRNLIVEKGV